jgi:ABC transporter DrrB family efflux protein
VAVILEMPAGDERAERLAKLLEASPDVKVKKLPPEETETALKRGDAPLVVSATDPPTYRYDPTHPESRATRLAVDAVLQRGLGRKDAFDAAEKKVPAPGASYVDWLVPGLIGMQIMNGSLWGIGFAIVEMRSRKLLKRFAVTPMKRHHFLLASAIHRSLVVGIEAVFLVLVAHLAFGVEVSGSKAAFGVVIALGTFSFLALALLVAARPKRTEVAAGLMNIPMIPQMIVSGVFFSSARFPEVVQPLIRALPLTALNDALRRIANEGGGLSSVARELTVLAAWGIGTLLLALKLFRWS